MCLRGLVLLLRDGPDLTPDHTPSARRARSPRGSLPNRLVLEPSASNPYRSLFPSRQRLLRRRRSDSRSGRHPFPATTVKSHADHTLLDPSSTAGDGSSQPPYLFKTTTVHDLPIHPAMRAPPRPRVQPLLEVLSAAWNDSSRSVSLNKTTTEHDSSQRPALTPESAPRLSAFVTVNGSSRTVTTDR